MHDIQRVTSGYVLVNSLVETEGLSKMPSGKCPSRSLSSHDTDKVQLRVVMSW
jgi:hypothetical protein